MVYINITLQQNGDKVRMTVHGHADNDEATPGEAEAGEAVRKAIHAMPQSVLEQSYDLKGTISQ
jgi:hypothetical protein